MQISKFAGKAQTVLGLVEGKDLGVTLPHEHLVVDGKAFYAEPSGATNRGLADKLVDIGNLSWLRYHPYENLDNVRLLDEQEAIDEVMLFKKAGGNTIVDVTSIGVGRDPKALARISRAIGLNVIMGAGYYTAPSQSPEMSSKTEEEITEEIVRDITIGVGDSGICAGIIGEIGGSWPLQDNERKVMRAAAHAQQLTGASINIHPGRKTEAPLEIVEILDDAGADLSRVIMSHIDARIRDHSRRCKLAKTGCSIEYDLWGWEGHFPSYWTADLLDLPNDTQRVYEIRQLIDEGYLNQILISHDICVKSRRVCYGGWGYAHISNYVVPMMLKRGLTQAQINIIMVENPKRMLCFV
ncbi:hypothetical protein ES703_124840 [subsurface metagenome]